MADSNFSDIGKIEAIRRLFDNSGFKHSDDICRFTSSNQGSVVSSSVLLSEGIDFDLTYFPLKHLGYKSVIAATGDIYAVMAHPKTLSVRLGISSKLDFNQIGELWEGIVSAAKQHGYKDISLDLLPSANGLNIGISSVGESSVLTDKRRRAAKSMDLICVSGNLGGAYMGQRVLEREKQRFLDTKDDRNQPELENYKYLVGEYLKPELNPSYVSLLEEEEIIPSYGYFVKKGLSDAVKRLVRDSGLGAKVYVDKIPFSNGIFDLGKELDIDPVSAAFNGGEDYRLLFTVPIGKHDKFRHDFQTFDIIGHLAKPEVGAALVTPDGIELPIKAQGWK